MNVTVVRDAQNVKFPSRAHRQGDGNNRGCWKHPGVSFFRGLMAPAKLRPLTRPCAEYRAADFHCRGCPTRTSCFFQPGDLGSEPTDLGVQRGELRLVRRLERADFRALLKEAG